MMATYLTILRPVQWLKNLMLFFPPFLVGQMFMPGVLITGVPPFGALCLVSSAGYILNDLVDRDKDTHHPRKRLRPIASGAIGVSGARMISALLLTSGLVLAGSISSRFLLLLACYAAVSMLYSLLLKSVPVVELFCISAGFLIRLQAGGELFHVPISPWLFLTVFLLAVFLSTGKRVSELHSLGDMAGKHRTSLSLYPPGFLDGTMYMTGSAVLVTYAMYALNKQSLIYSVPLCLFGLLRYMFRVSTGKGGDPTESLLKDPLLFVVGVLWVLMVVWSIYP
ncbi:MAG: decaprenyl-phosphate phosphoribosyltransferase [Desulfuromonadaceae bacterium]|nr:decaprenyl-phosphate phosphoribosyltransferase [Desulfuromonadaceae bacterium]MDD5106386.1 decaprenyl-phosphate phosphoribosyltransferase [Desulfuromonadaceae bacterium]